jgi:hypothetical protein
MVAKRLNIRLMAINRFFFRITMIVRRKKGLKNT